MAILSGGITGKVRGKSGNLVFGSWKGINYAREKVIPANPKSAGQVTQRTKVSDTVAFAKSILSSVINEYWEKKYPKMSGYNAFCKINIPLTDATDGITESNFSMIGSLEGAAISSAEYDTATGDIAVVFPTSTLGNGLATDSALVVVWDNANKVAFVADGGEVRSAGQYDLSIGAGRTATDLAVFLSFYRGTGSSQLQSNSSGAMATAA